MMDKAKRESIIEEWRGERELRPTILKKISNQLHEHNVREHTPGITRQSQKLSSQMDRTATNRFSRSFVRFPADLEAVLAKNDGVDNMNRSGVASRNNELIAPSSKPWTASTPNLLPNHNPSSIPIRP